MIITVLLVLLTRDDFLSLTLSIFVTKALIMQEMKKVQNVNTLQLTILHLQSVFPALHQVGNTQMPQHKWIAMPTVQALTITYMFLIHSHQVVPVLHRIQKEQVQ